MPKDYSKWHLLKSKIEQGCLPPLFREKEIWWCSLGANVGTEEDGKFYHSFNLHDQERTAILSQLRVLSAKRLIRRLGKISDTQFFILQCALNTFLKETDPLRDPRVPTGNL